jgi:hypothetical protein
MNMFWKKKTDQNPLGVPLGDLALMLSTGTIKTSFDGNALLAKHDHYTTRVEVVPAAPGATKDEPIKAVVQVTTELPAPIQRMMKGREIESAAAFNPMAALGALTFDKSRIYIGSRLTIFEREDAWRQLYLPLLLFTIIGGTEGILGAMRRTFGGEPPREGDSEWDEDEFESLEEMMSRFCVCSSGGLGFTAEFALQQGATSAAAGHHNTALLQLRADQPHPELGGGLFVLLQLPHRLPGTRDVQEMCARLNALEMEAVDLPPHFGAWCPGGLKTNLAYVSFLPNALHSVPDLARHAVMWAFHRAQWSADRVARLAHE